MKRNVPAAKPRREGVRFPAAEPTYRALRLRSAKACAEYNSQAEFVSVQERGRLWENIVLTDVQAGLDASSFSAIHLSPGLPVETGASDCGASKTALSTMSSSTGSDIRGIFPLEQPFSELCRIPDTMWRTPAANTPPPSPEPNLLSPRPVGDETIKPAVEVYPDTTTPPPSRKTSLPELIEQSKSPDCVMDGGTLDLPGADPATSNPFLVDAPYVKPPVYIDYGTNLHIGSNTFINRNLTVCDSPVREIRIGKRCLLGPNVMLVAIEHPLDAAERISPCGAPSIAYSIEIGDDCWIGADVKVLGGVRIGAGCVVGAGSVVTRDIPDGYLAFGVPARPVRLVSPSKSEGELAGALDLAEESSRCPACPAAAREVGMEQMEEHACEEDGTAVSHQDRPILHRELEKVRWQDMVLVLLSFIIVTGWIRDWLGVR